MYTFGAVLLAIIGSLFMQFLLGLISSLLAVPMYESVGYFLPILLIVVFTGFAHYGGLCFALLLVPGADASKTLRIVVSIIIFLTAYGLVKEKTDQGYISGIMLILNCLAAVIGSYYAKVMVGDDRKQI